MVKILVFWVTIPCKLVIGNYVLEDLAAFLFTVYTQLLFDVLVAVLRKWA
jgi:hypothetical protein